MRESDRSGRRRPGGLRRNVAAIACSIGLGALGIGCGDSPPRTETAAVPQGCLESWNQEDGAQTSGRHAYAFHGVREAEVSLIEPDPSAATPAETGASGCAVIFAVAENDAEFGSLGQVETAQGWRSMQGIAPTDPGRLLELQQAASAAPNAGLFPDGTLQPR